MVTTRYTGPRLELDINNTQIGYNLINITIIIICIRLLMETIFIIKNLDMEITPNIYSQ